MVRATKDNNIVFSDAMIAAVDTGIKVYFVHTAGKKANYDTCPFGTVGSLLWVQEKHQYLYGYPEHEGQRMEAIKLSQEVRHAPNVVLNAAAQAELGDTDPFQAPVNSLQHFGWNTPNRAARQLPDWASRLTLQIAEIGYTPLQELACDVMRLDLGLAGCTDEQLVRKYVSYWDSSHREGYRWVSNPIVWVVGFNAIWKNISKI